MAVAAPWGKEMRIPYDVRDVLLYNIGIGCQGLRFVYEQDSDFAPFPTFPIRFGGYGAAVQGFVPVVGPLNIDAERYIEVFRPLPTSGEIFAKARVIGLHPKGRAAFLEYETIITDSAGIQFAKIVNGAFIRGMLALGDILPFEGAGKTYSQKLSYPQRPPDVTTEAIVAENQSAIYRLSGDYNPLHIDPAAAKFGGFDRVILHGMCTLGMSSSALVRALCGNDASKFRKIKVRFSSPVYLGDTLSIEAWHDRPGRVIFRVTVKERPEAGAVIEHAFFEYDVLASKM
eukprot:TRINITY_DN27425_c0_g1_i1.p1 TRINITY_DN27425_c0_g1~~TRINITY_DN27425_c0_g1_i1.p1  ORF type:complete len:312 (+),score=53.94 TRINITY_DN27425_c0_g1_i1:76-936(+)